MQDEFYWSDRSIEDMSKDWGGRTYEESKDHPHRELIIKALKSFDFSSVLEVGCNSGPNLLRIAETLPDVILGGIDPNLQVIEKARELLPKAVVKRASVLQIPFEDKGFDIVLADAVLMYVQNITAAMGEIDRVAKRGIIICDWATDGSVPDGVQDFHYVRNYKKLLEDLGYSVISHKITTEEWTNLRWNTHGHLFTAVRQ